MTVYEIPLKGGQGSIQNLELIQADGVTTLGVRLFVHWNAPLGVWVLDLDDAQGTPLASGIPMITGADLLAQYPYLGLGGALLAQSDFDWTVPPNFADLGATGHLYWIPIGPAPSPPPAYPLSPEDLSDEPQLPTIPPPHVAPPPLTPACLANVGWVASTGGHGQGLDQYNNYLSDSIYNATTGAINATITAAEMAAGVNAWIGSPVCQLGYVSPTSTVLLHPILGGQYLIGYFGGNDQYGDAAFAKWFALYQPSATGAPTVVGAVWYSNLLGIPYASVPQPFLAGLQTADDPILILGGYGIGAFVTSLAPLPSINQIKSGIYSGTSNPYYPTHPGQVPYLGWQWLGNENLCTYLYNSLWGLNLNPRGLWTLPGPNGGTNVYLYFNRAYTESCMGTPSVLKNPELNLVLAAEYPHGCVVRVNLGVIPDFDTLHRIAAGSGALPPTPMYTVDNADWLDATGAVAVPFVDEYTWLSTGAAGGTDAYQQQPAILAPVGAAAPGQWSVGMIMQGIDDARTNLGNTHEFATIRLFRYDPQTQIFRQRVIITCTAWTNATVPQPYPNSGDYTTFFHFDAGGHLWLTGSTGSTGVANVYLSEFASGISP